MALQHLKDTWDLDVFFKGGSDSPAFQAYLKEIKTLISSFKEKADALDGAKAESGGLKDAIELFETIDVKIRQSDAYVGCLQAQNMTDLKANALNFEVTRLNADFQKVLVIFDNKLADINEALWEKVLNECSDIAFILNERRSRVKEKLGANQESLIEGLAVDGYHAWGDLYNSIIGQIQIPYEEDGETKILSVGQANNLTSKPDRKIRKSVSKNLDHAWEQHADLFSSTLNHLAGFRLNVYEARGWEDVLKEPLEINRMKRETLDAMWQVIIDHKQPFVDYLKRKASLLGLEKLDWFDVDAPPGSAAKEYSYDEAANFITEQFETFGKKLSSFAEKAFKDRWIEAENRGGKRPGGFCANFPDSRQSRIFMTYSGSASNVSTLAHELGHAFHQEVIMDVRPMNRAYAMNVAETASTFAEMITADAALQQADSDEEKLVLLEDKIQRSVAFFMNIHARFLFETRFYEERKNGVVSAGRLNELMEEAQREAFCGALGEYHPYFWASKLHFYITSIPFYNFPYTFGYLFSLGIYSRALKEGQAFEEKYIALLKDTASMTVEDLAMKHLGADLTKRNFWEEAIALAVRDAEQFLALT
ncbi:oligoendopeptidase [Bacillus glycinifermentans]|uniref:Oligoendopeptidase n=1 Tax=Bacillus glycinifermentans TaxID=1664069 RepID=A0A0J6EUP1_9BACI|nr:M3 family oligoendopeptidase [Bacillus glycinifermentans]ATH93076.1 oligoendopeptidase [Bacillus glycinifermentans]KMM56240.1 oligoendopeptidase [Bacillus glycinifermentans]KRT94319.1 oligoendopeptidase [Bacillus glycinifermentans]MEC0485848.1 M3 family oligoendopeptidase [Bacillus glycinifermentans]MEC0495674.1 M3 family oligoendopeptidase [Bacillus glycinifermentans]